MTDSILNRKIGRYEIQEHIGEGAMAMVYRAFDPEINRSVACKVLKADHCVDEEYMSRFVREAKAAGSLSHHAIVTVFDVGKIDGSPYIMMELLQGKDLGEVLKEKKTIGIKETLTIALQLAKALDYAHSTGIVHRDIKPDNIIVLPDGETIKVADFGIARMNENEESQKTQVGAVLGTPRYMSPEQALGNDVDGRSDLFSVGVIMYEMLTGAKAFDATNMGTLMMQIAQKQPEPLKKIAPEVSTGLRQIVQKLLQKSPDKRYQNGGELADALIKELNSYRDQQEEQKKHKYIPLKIKWTLSAVFIVATVLLISMKVVFGLQSSAMTKQAVDSGSSFARFIATETAIPLLSEDWITLETFINDAASRDTFAYLIVTDRSGIIRGASNSELVGQMYEDPKDAELISESDDIYTTSSTFEDSAKVFNIKTPILFQSTEVGTIVLGLSQESLDEVKSVTSGLMFTLAAITISLVGLIMFIFGGLISRPLKSVSRALHNFASGDLDTRISLTRKDEIGEVFDDFNHMAAAIQERYTEVADELAQSGIQLPSKESSSELDGSMSAGTGLPEQSLDEVDEATIMASSLINMKDQEVDEATVMASSLMTSPPSSEADDLESNDQSQVSQELPQNTDAPVSTDVADQELGEEDRTMISSSFQPFGDSASKPAEADEAKITNEDALVEDALVKDALVENVESEDALSEGTASNDGAREDKLGKTDDLEEDESDNSQVNEDVSNIDIDSEKSDEKTDQDTESKTQKE